MTEYDPELLSAQTHAKKPTAADQSGRLVYPWPDGARPRTDGDAEHE